MGRLSPRGSVWGTWREGSFTGTPKRMLNKALEMGVCFHRDPAFGEPGGMVPLLGLQREC